MINLSSEQKAIINADITKSIHVSASAGAGKTRVLTERIRYILKQTSKEGIIALTFTNKAAEEMLSRLENCDDVHERCWIATIHSVAQRILGQYGHTIGLPSELHIYEREQDRKTIFIQSLINNSLDSDFFINSDDTKKYNKKLNKYMEQFSIVKKELLTEEEIKEKYSSLDDFWQVYQNYQETLLASGGIDFDDILLYAYQILLEQPWCANIYQTKYRYLSVDEAQDLNRAQYEFIKILCGEKIKSVMMVGDPNQMIYGFNGSSSAYFCKLFISDYTPQLFELKKNYRSSKEVVRLANKLKSNSQTASNFALTGRSEIVEQKDEKTEAEWVCDKITELLNLRNDDEIEGDITLSKMVVIARNRFAFITLEKILKERGITYSLKKGERQPEPTSIFGKILDLIIRVKLNPKDWLHRKKLHEVLKISIPSTQELELDTLIYSAKTAPILFSEIQSDMIKSIRELDNDKPKIPKFCEEYEKRLKEISQSTSQDSSLELERSLQELNEFKNCWMYFKRQGLGESLSSFKNAMALGQLTTENAGTSTLTLSTVHTMKGLEKDIVFLISMCEDVFPDYRARSQKDITEERNNAFVAVTRARRWIYITYPTSREMPWGDKKTQSKSRFLTDMQKCT